MSTTNDLVQSLFRKRQMLVESSRALLDDVSEGRRRADAQTDATFNRMSAEINELGQRLDELVGIEEHSNGVYTQRERFGGIVYGRPGREETELSRWLRYGGSPTYDVQLERHDLTTGGASAGDVVPDGFVGAFYQHMIATAAVRQTNALVYTTSGGEPLKLPKSVADSTAAIVAEGSAITPNDPDFDSVTLGAYGFKSMVFVSRELTEDSSVNIEAILGRLLGRAIGTASGEQYVLGDGTTEPEGVALTPVDGAVGTWANLIAGATGPDLLTDLYFSVHAPYRPQGYWFMNDATLAAIRKLKSSTNEYLVDRNLTTTPTETIFGRPVVTDPNMATGAGAGTRILFGSFADYFAIRDVGGVRIERSDDYRFANDEIAFRAVLRTDSKQVLNDADNAAVKALRTTA